MFLKCTIIFHWTKFFIVEKVFIYLKKKTTYFTEIFRIYCTVGYMLKKKIYLAVICVVRSQSF